MKYEDIKSIFDRDSELKFRLYNLEYIIKECNNGVEVFAMLYQNSKKKFISFDDAMNSFTVFNESLIDNIDQITVLL